MPQENGQPFDERLLREIRERFCHVESDPISGARIYLENAGGSLTLKRVVEVVAAETTLPDNAGRANPTSRQIDATIAGGAEDVRTLSGACSGTILVGGSTTSNAFTVLNAIIRNVPGDSVVTTNLDHPALFDSTRVLAERFNKQWRVAQLSREAGLVQPETVASLVDSRTIVLTVIHSSNITGVRNDLKAIISAARRIKPDLHVVVDGATFGNHGVVDVNELGCDAYLLSSYKLFSKVGAAVACLSDRIARLPHDKLIGKPESYWELGTVEQAGYAAWSEVVNYFCWLGGHFTTASGRRDQVIAAMNAIELHERALTFRMLQGREGLPGLLRMPHVTVYGAFDNLIIQDPCLIFNVEGMKSGEAVAFLGERGIRVHNRISDAYSRHTLQGLGLQECVRVSAAHYNSPGEVDAFLRAVDAAKK